MPRSQLPSIPILGGKETSASMERYEAKSISALASRLSALEIASTDESRRLESVSGRVISLLRNVVLIRTDANLCGRTVVNIEEEDEEEDEEDDKEKAKNCSGDENIASMHGATREVVESSDKNEDVGKYQLPAVAAAASGPLHQQDDDVNADVNADNADAVVVAAEAHAVKRRKAAESAFFSALARDMLHVGERVEARCGDGDPTFYPGEVSKVVHGGRGASSSSSSCSSDAATKELETKHNQTDGLAPLLFYDVDFDDGDRKQGQPRLRLRRPGEKQLGPLLIGQVVEARFGGGRKFFGARVLEKLGPQANRHLSTNHEEEGTQEPLSQSTFHYTLCYEDGDVEGRVPRSMIQAQHASAHALKAFTAMTMTCLAPKSLYEKDDDVAAAAAVASVGKFISEEGGGGPGGSGGASERSVEEEEVIVVIEEEDDETDDTGIIKEIEEEEEEEEDSNDDEDDEEEADEDEWGDEILDSEQNTAVVCRNGGNERDYGDDWGDEIDDPEEVKHGHNGGSLAEAADSKAESVEEEEATEELVLMVAKVQRVALERARTKDTRGNTTACAKEIARTSATASATAEAAAVDEEEDEEDEATAVFSLMTGSNKAGQACRDAVAKRPKIPGTVRVLLGGSCPLGLSLLLIGLGVKDRVLVAAVAPGGQGDRCGLRSGDLLVELNGQELEEESLSFGLEACVLTRILTTPVSRRPLLLGVLVPCQWPKVWALEWEARQTKNQKGAGNRRCFSNVLDDDDEEEQEVSTKRAATASEQQHRKEKKKEKNEKGGSGSCVVGVELAKARKRQRLLPVMQATRLELVLDLGLAEALQKELGFTLVRHLSLLRRKAVDGTNPVLALAIQHAETVLRTKAAAVAGAVTAVATKAVTAVVAKAVTAVGLGEEGQEVEDQQEGVKKVGRRMMAAVRRGDEKELRRLVSVMRELSTHNLPTGASRGGACGGGFSGASGGKFDSVDWAGGDEEEGSTALHVAARTGSVALVNLLVSELGATHDLVDANGDSPLELARLLFHEDHPVVQFLALLTPSSHSTKKQSAETPPEALSALTAAATAVAATAQGEVEEGQEGEEQEEVLVVEEAVEGEEDEEGEDEEDAFREEVEPPTPGRKSNRHSDRNSSVEGYGENDDAEDSRRLVGPNGYETGVLGKRLLELGLDAWVAYALLPPKVPPKLLSLNAQKPRLRQQDRRPQAQGQRGQLSGDGGKDEEDEDGEDGEGCFEEDGSGEGETAKGGGGGDLDLAAKTSASAVAALLRNDIEVDAVEDLEYLEPEEWAQVLSACGSRVLSQPQHECLVCAHRHLLAALKSDAKFAAASAAEEERWARAGVSAAVAAPATSSHRLSDVD